MKSTVFGLFGGTLLAFAFWSIVGFGAPAAAQSSVYQPSGELIAMSTSIDIDRVPMQQVTVIDPRSRAMSVYHVDSKSGAVTLKSVRRIEYDLQMTEYNTTNPMPSEIRASLPPR